MKYIRTKDGIFERMFPNDEQRISFDHKTIEPAYYTTNHEWIAKKDVIKQADAIKELCDEFEIILPAGIYRFGIYHARYEGWGDFKRAWRDFKEKNGDDYRHYEMLGAHGAIWTDKGLIYVAKMNDEGELELL